MGSHILGLNDLYRAACLMAGGSLPTISLLSHKGIAMQTYRTFKRSCTDWESFASARKITVATRLSYSEALQQCKDYNDNRTPAQIRRGTMMEFERE